MPILQIVVLLRRLRIMRPICESRCFVSTFSDCWFHELCPCPYLCLRALHLCLVIVSFPFLFVLLAPLYLLVFGGTSILVYLLFRRLLLTFASVRRRIKNNVTLTNYVRLDFTRSTLNEGRDIESLRVNDQ